MAKYEVPVRFELTGHITVEANSPQEAIHRTIEVWNKRGKAAIELPCAEVDIAHGEDESEVRLAE